MFNRNIISNKFDLNLSTTLSSYWCTAKFQEITLPALRFEKVEETDTKKWKKWERYTEEKRRSTTLDEAKKPKEKTTPKEKQNHSQENDTQRSFKNRKHL